MLTNNVKDGAAMATAVTHVVSLRDSLVTLRDAPDPVPWNVFVTAINGCQMHFAAVQRLLPGSAAEIAERVPRLTLAQAQDAMQRFVSARSAGQAFIAAAATAAATAPLSWATQYDQTTGYFVGGSIPAADIAAARALLPPLIAELDAVLAIGA